MRGGACAPSHSVFHETICFTEEMICGICSMDDFYKATGIAVLVKGKIITDVRQVWMNKLMCEGLEDIGEGNLKRQKKYRHWSEHALHTAVAMDWLCYSPAGIDYVPDGELWIWSQEDAETAIEEYRAWLKEVDRDDQEKDR